MRIKETHRIENCEGKSGWVFLHRRELDHESKVGEDQYVDSV